MPSDHWPPEPPAHHQSGELQEGAIEIPYQSVSTEALDAILTDFVTREGTDYGDYVYSLEDKKSQVLRQLKTGTATLLFDPIQQSCHIEITRTLRHRAGSLELPLSNRSCL